MPHWSVRSPAYGHKQNCVLNAAHKWSVSKASTSWGQFVTDALHFSIDYEPMIERSCAWTAVFWRFSKRNTCMPYSLFMSVNDNRALISDCQVDLSDLHAKQTTSLYKISTWKFASLLTLNLRDEFNPDNAVDRLSAWNASTGMG